MSLDTRADEMLTATEILTNEFGPLHDVEIFQTWGPTLVMRASLANDCMVVIKASAMQDVRIEAKISMIAATAGVRAPRILAKGEDARLPGRHWFAMEHLAGVPWYRAGWSQSQNLAMLPELARHLVALHRVRIEGFGPLNLDGSGASASWSDWLRSGFERTLTALEPVALLPPGFPSELIVALQNLSPELDRRPSVLLHADLGDMEVYVAPEDGCVTGIVDWGSSIGGDPVYEFSRFVAGGPADDPRPGRYRHFLREAYDRLSPSLPPLNPAIERLYDLHNTLLNAEWAVKEAPDWVDPLCAQAEALLDSLR